jgi:hypothetical protein
MDRDQSNYTNMCRINAKAALFLCVLLWQFSGLMGWADDVVQYTDHGLFPLHSTTLHPLPYSHHETYIHWVVSSFN